MHILLNWILQGAIVAAATAAGLRLLRGAPAATRHGVCWIGLVAILALPLVPSLWSVAVAPAPPSAASTTQVRPLETRTVAAQPLAARIGPDAPFVRLPALFSAVSVLLGAAWLLWTMLQGVRVVRDVRWLRHARRRCKRLPAIVAARFSPETTRLAAQTHTRIALCDAVRAAAVLGGGRPLIGLQPRLMRELSDRELNAMLVHELAHVVRRDAWATVVQRAVHIVVGWHPGVWWLLRRITLEREMACDETALAVAGGPKAYATCLTRIAGLTRTVVRSPALALSMLAASGLQRRVVHILTPAGFSRRTARIASGTLATGLCVLSAAIGTVTVFGAPAVGEMDATVETATARTVRPWQEATPVSITRASAETSRSQAAKPAARTPVPTPGSARADIRTDAAAIALQTPASPDGGTAPATTPPPITQSADVPAAPLLPAAEPSATLPDRITAAEPAVAPGTAAAISHDRTVADAAVGAAVGTAAGATDAWNAAADAAASTGVAVGRGTQRGAVKTAGAFARWGRRIASPF